MVCIQYIVQQCPASPDTIYLNIYIAGLPSLVSPHICHHNSLLSTLHSQCQHLQTVIRTSPGHQTVNISCKFIRIIVLMRQHWPRLAAETRDEVGSSGSGHSGSVPGVSHATNCSHPSGDHPWSRGRGAQCHHWHLPSHAHTQLQSQLSHLLPGLWSQLWPLNTDLGLHWRPEDILYQDLQLSPEDNQQHCLCDIFDGEYSTEYQ